MASQQDLQSMALSILLIAVSSYLVHLQSHGQSHGEQPQGMEVLTERLRREKKGQKPPSSEADSIAKASQPAISRRMEKESTFHAQRISESENFKPPQDIGAFMVNRQSDDALSQISGNEDAIAFYELLKPFITAHLDDAQQAKQITVDVAQAILDLIQQRAIRDWTNNEHVQQDMQSAIDDYLYEVVHDKHRINLTPDAMDEILEKSLQLAKKRSNLVQSRISMVEKGPSQKVAKRN